MLIQANYEEGAHKENEDRSLRFKSIQSIEFRLNFRERAAMGTRLSRARVGWPTILHRASAGTFAAMRAETLFAIEDERKLNVDHLPCAIASQRAQTRFMAAFAMKVQLLHG